MDVPALISAAEELADSPDPIDSMLAVTLCYFAARSMEQVGGSQDNDLTRAGYIVANAWERALFDGARLIALPVLDRVLLLASTGELDMDARELEEINNARVRAGKPFWSTDGVS
jgi:hypothetical protein